MIDYQPYHKALSDVNSLLTAHWPKLKLHIKHLDNIVKTSKDLEKENSLDQHPLKIEFHQIIEGNKSNRLEDYFGVIKKQKKMLSLGSESSELKALILLQPEHYGLRDVKEPVDDYEKYLYRMTFMSWHVLDLALNVEKDRTYNQITPELYVHQRSRLEQARQNLKADIISMLVLKALGYENAIRQVVTGYARKTLETTALSYPEIYPLPVAYDVCFQAFEIFKDDLENANDLLGKSIEVADYVLKIISKQDITIWQKYCVAAQTLAWSGTAPDYILASAIDLCDKPEIRMCAFSVAELLAVKAPRLEKSESAFNAFASEDQQLSAHQKYVDRAFEKCMSQAIKSGQGEPFFDMADEQNTNLAKGMFFGWCAPSLQAVGHYIKNGSFQGELPQDIARMHFEGSKRDYKVTEIQQLARILMNERRKGRELNLQNLYSFMQNKKINKTITNSIKHTLIHQGIRKGDIQDTEQLESKIAEYSRPYNKDSADLEIRAISYAK